MTNKKLYIQLLEAEVERLRATIDARQHDISELMDKVDPTRVPMRNIGKELEKQVFSGLGAWMKPEDSDAD